MKVSAKLPDGATQRLLHIKDWDFNWQDEYGYQDPIFLPKGSVLQLSYVYDNSDENVRNPNVPPKRVRYGEGSRDEMGDLWLQVLTGSERDRNVLTADFGERELRAQIAGFEAWLKRVPHASRFNNLGRMYAAKNEMAKAERYFRKALEMRPNYAKAHNNMGIVYLRQRRFGEAIRSFQRALRLEPRLKTALANMGIVYMRQGKLVKAKDYLQKALAIDPDYITPQRGLQELEWRAARQQQR